MGMRQERRKNAHALKGIGLPFVLRHTLAKASARFERHEYVLKRKRFTRVARWGCDCCDPEHTQVWEGLFQGHNYRITTEWGRVEYCERI